MSTELTLTATTPVPAAQPAPERASEGKDLGRWIALGTIGLAGLATIGFWIATFFWLRRLLA